MSPDTVAFASALFDGVPEHLHALLWTLQDKRSSWVPLTGGSAAVARQATALSAEDKDTYIAVSVARESGGAFSRITSENSAGLMGLWADIDIADPDVHRKFNLPPDQDSALDLLDRSGVEPSLVIHSGHGLQAWWLFDEFWEFESENDRLTAATLAHRWNTTLRVKAAERSLTLDSVFDLARVMRVPGTLNRKGDPVMPVRLLSQNAKRYGREDFDFYCVDEKEVAHLGISVKQDYIVGDLTLRADALPDMEMLEQVRENHPLFDKTWRRERKDFTDGSQSSYDLSICSILVKIGWSDQEAWNTVIAHRRKHGEDMKKPLRLDYATSTLAQAHETDAQEAAHQEMRTATVALGTAKRTGDDEEIRLVRRHALGTVSDALGTKIINIYRYDAQPPSFAVETPIRTMHFPDTRALQQQPNFIVTAWGELNVQIVKMKPARWDDVTAAMLEAMIDLDVGRESTDAGKIDIWLDEYLQARPVVEGSPEEAALTQSPYRDADGLHVFGPSLRAWVNVTYGEKLKPAELGRLFRLIQGSPRTMPVQSSTGRTTREVWDFPGRRS